MTSTRISPYNKPSMEKIQIQIPSITRSSVNYAYPVAIQKHRSNSLSSKASPLLPLPLSRQRIFPEKDLSSRQSAQTYPNSTRIQVVSVPNPMSKLAGSLNSEKVKLHQLDHLIRVPYLLHRLFQPLHRLMWNYQIILPPLHIPQLQHTPLLHLQPDQVGPPVVVGVEVVGD